MKAFVVVLPLSVVLAGCLTQPPAPSVDHAPPVQAKAATVIAPPQAKVPDAGRTYTVRRGDTLYRIALENGQDYRDLATWNGLSNASSIKEGQVLRLSPPGSTEAGGVAKPIATAPVVETRSLDTPAPVAASNDKIKREPKVGKEPYSDEAYNRMNRLSAATETTSPVPDSRPAVTESKPESAKAPLNPDDVSWSWPVNGKILQGFGQSGSKGVDFVGKSGDPVTAAGDGKVVYAGAGLPGYGELVIIKHNATYLSAYGHNRKILVKEGQTVTRGQKIAEMGNTGTDTVKLHFEIRKQGNPVDPVPFLPKK